MLSFRIARRFLVAACVAGALSTHLGAQARPCATPSALAQKRIDALRTALSAPNPGQTRWMNSVGLTPTAASDVVVETDSTVCTAVTDAVQAALGAEAATTNLVVVRAGSRYVALRADGVEGTLFTLTSSYGDVRASVSQG